VADRDDGLFEQFHCTRAGATAGRWRSRACMRSPASSRAAPAPARTVRSRWPGCSRASGRSASTPTAAWRARRAGKLARWLAAQLRSGGARK